MGEVIELKHFRKEKSRKSSTLCLKKLLKGTLKLGDKKLPESLVGSPANGVDTPERQPQAQALDQALEAVGELSAAELYNVKQYDVKQCGVKPGDLALGEASLMEDRLPAADFPFAPRRKVSPSNNERAEHSDARVFLSRAANLLSRSGEKERRIAWVVEDCIDLLYRTDGNRVDAGCSEGTRAPRSRTVVKTALKRE